MLEYQMNNRGNNVCPACGVGVLGNASFCPVCYQSLDGRRQGRSPQKSNNDYGRPEDSVPYTLPPVRDMKKPNNYLVWSILCTLLLCFLPLGIIALVYSIHVNSLWRDGDCEGAIEASRKAKKWCWITTFVPLAFLLVIFIIAFWVLIMSLV